MCHIFFIHSSVVGHLGCFHISAIVNSAAMKAYDILISAYFFYLTSCHNLLPICAPHLQLCLFFTLIIALKCIFLILNKTT